VFKPYFDQIKKYKESIALNCSIMEEKNKIFQQLNHKLEIINKKAKNINDPEKRFNK